VAFVDAAVPGLVSATEFQRRLFSWQSLQFRRSIFACTSDLEMHHAVKSNRGGVKSNFATEAGARARGHQARLHAVQRPPAASPAASRPAEGARGPPAALPTPPRGTTRRGRSRRAHLCDRPRIAFAGVARARAGRGR
jgi:hypothetical protein